VQLRDQKARQFMQTVEERANISLNDQLDVGFFSVFLVKDRAVVTSKHNNNEQ
jgi:HSP90 family molecular chaperone